jgi:hypothetical protein
MTERGAVDSAAASSLSFNMAAGTLSLANLHLISLRQRLCVRIEEDAESQRDREEEGRRRSSLSQAEDELNPNQYFEVQSGVGP